MDLSIAHMPAHTHTVVRRGKGLQIRVEKKPRNARSVNFIEAKPLYEKRELFLEKNQVSIFLFHLVHYINRDSINTFLVHKHKPYE